MTDDEEDAFLRQVRRQAEQIRSGRAMTFWKGLSLVGAIGWMVSLPAVGGAFLGRWLDSRAGGGLFWTLTLLLLGLGLGIASAWRHTQKELRG